MTNSVFVNPHWFVTNSSLIYFLSKSSVEAVEALKVSEHNPTSPKDLQDYILSKNNGPRDTGKSIVFLLMETKGFAPPLVQDSVGTLVTVDLDLFTVVFLDSNQVL